MLTIYLVHEKNDDAQQQLPRTVRVLVDADSADVHDARRQGLDDADSVHCDCALLATPMLPGRAAQQVQQH
jgi:hypothetical protein